MSWTEFFQQSLDAAATSRARRQRVWQVDLSPTEFRRADGRTLINFGTNDYLGLRHDPRVLDAARQSLSSSGAGAGASPLVSGYNLPLAELERRLASWQHAEACLVFSSGFAMNVGVISALVGGDDLVLSDRLNHASLIDGCRLSGAHKRVFAHNDVAAVREQLSVDRHRYQKSLVICESIFSMDGDRAPLSELLNVCQHYDAGLLVDEAHATGVYGQTGAGLGEQLGESSQWLGKLGTLSKSIGTCGGFVTGSRSLIDFLVHRCRSYLFSTAIAPPVVAASTASVRLMPELNDRRARLLSTSAHVRGDLANRGYQLVPGDSPIIPVIVGSNEDTLKLSARALEHGCYVPAIRPPTVPQGTARLRISLSALHSDQQIQRLLDSFD